MNSIIEIIIRKLTGKSDFILAKEVPLSYILKTGIYFIRGLIRGFFRGIGIKKGSRLFIGPKVSFYCKKNIQCGNSVRIESGSFINALGTRGIVLNDKVKIGRGSEINCSGTLSNLGEGIIIGKNSSFAENTYFGAAGGIKIGEDVISGQNVRFHSENHNYNNIDIPIRLQGVNRKGIVIGNNVWIGAGAVFLDGAVVGNGCIIGANTIVNKKYPDNSIIVGNPGKVIKNRIGD